LGFEKKKAQDMAYVNYPRNERNTNRANRPANPPSKKVFTSSTIPPMGSNPVE
jgi:hypothetical protein